MTKTTNLPMMRRFDDVRQKMTGKGCDCHFLLHDGGKMTPTRNLRLVYGFLFLSKVLVEAA